MFTVERSYVPIWKKTSGWYTGKLFKVSSPPLEFSLYLCQKNKAVHETTQRT